MHIFITTSLLQCMIRCAFFLTDIWRQSFQTSTCIYITACAFLLICADTFIHTQIKTRRRGTVLLTGKFKERIHLLRINLSPCSYLKSGMFPLILRNQEKLHSKLKTKESDKKTKWKPWLILFLMLVMLQ